MDGVHWHGAPITQINEISICALFPPGYHTVPIHIQVQIDNDLSSTSMVYIDIKPWMMSVVGNTWGREGKMKDTHLFTPINHSSSNFR